jgi:hypothetical protein
MDCNLVTTIYTVSISSIAFLELHTLLSEGVELKGEVGSMPPAARVMNGSSSIMLPHGMRNNSKYTIVGVV